MAATVRLLIALALVLSVSACGGGGGGNGGGGGGGTPASLTSIDHTTFLVGNAGTFSVTSTGSPVPSLTLGGSLPAGVAFNDHGNGSGTLAGMPGAGSSGAYSLTITAHNGSGTDGVQRFTLTVNAAPAATAYPLKASANGRYLVDQNNIPFMIVGDSPQSLIGNLSETDAETYFADRQARGFNAVWINLLCDSYTGCHSDGTTFDGIAPFTTPDDLSTPNPAYFQRVDHMIQLAANHGLMVLLDPIETGGWLSTITANTQTTDHNYGQFLGNRYKNVHNIVWLSGNDFQTWNTDSTANADVQAIGQGIHDADLNHIQTIELDYRLSASRDDSAWSSILGLDAAYTYFPTYAEILNEYQLAPSIPVLLIEANYEFEQNATDPGNPATLRRQEYWTMLSGATGHMYGNHYIWPFLTGWQSVLSTTGTTQLGYLTSFLKPRQWFNLVPDNSHSFVTANNGTFSSTDTISNNDYLTAGVTPDGTFAAAYLPTSRTITVNMSKLSALATVRWFDPSSGTYTAIAGSPFANSGSRQFTPPGNNSDGDGDWVLVFEVTPVSP